MFVFFALLTAVTSFETPANLFMSDKLKLILLNFVVEAKKTTWSVIAISSSAKIAIIQLRDFEGDQITQLCDPINISSWA